MCQPYIERTTVLSDIDAQFQQNSSESSPGDMQGVPGAIMQATDLVRITQKTPVLIITAC